MVDPLHYERDRAADEEPARQPTDRQLVDSMLLDDVIITLAGPIAGGASQRRPMYTPDDVAAGMTTDDRAVVDAALESSGVVVRTLSDGRQESDVSTVIALQFRGPLSW